MILFPNMKKKKISPFGRRSLPTLNKGTAEDRSRDAGARLL